MNHHVISFGCVIGCILHIDNKSAIHILIVSVRFRRLYFIIIQSCIVVRLVVSNSRNTFAGGIHRRNIKAMIFVATFKDQFSFIDITQFLSCKIGWFYISHLIVKPIILPHHNFQVSRCIAHRVTIQCQVKIQLLRFST